MTAKASGEINTRYELVDSNGIVPIRLSEKEYVRAHDFRRYLHKNLEDFIIETPLENPLGLLNKKFDVSLINDIQNKWVPYNFESENIDDFLENLNIDKTVEISSIRGGYAIGDDHNWTPVCKSVEEVFGTDYKVTGKGVWYAIKD